MRKTTLLLLTLLVASPGAALDITGTWVGKFTCTEFDGTRTKYTVSDDVMMITQVGDTFAVDSLNQFSGVSIPDARKPLVQGEVKMANCTTDASMQNGGDELARLKAKVDRQKGKGKLKGTSVYTGPGLVGTCKWSYKLTDLADPAATGCAP